MKCFAGLRNRRRAMIQIALTGVILLSSIGLLPARETGHPALVFSSQMASTSVPKLNQALRSYQIILADLNQLTEDASTSGRIRVQLENVVRDLVLEPNDLQAPGLRWTETTAAGVFDVPATPVSTYKGEIEGEANTQVRVLIQPDLFLGYIRQGDDYLFIEPLSKFVPGAPAGQVVAYHERDVRPEFQGLCGTTPLHDIGLRLLGRHWGNLSKSGRYAAVTFRRLQVASDADFEEYTARGSSVGGTNTYITGILNQVDGIYRTNLNLGVSITFQNVYSTPSNPYTSNIANTLLSQFVTNWTTNHAGVTRDVAHLFTGKTLNSGIVGIAYVSAACDPNYEYGLTSDTTSFTLKVAAHEIGHNLGAQHDDTSPPPILSCPGNGFLMCSYIQPSGPNQFSQKSKDAIAAYVASAATPSCLAQLTGAPVVNTDPATAVTLNTATLNGTVNPNGSATNVMFQYGTTTSYGTSTSSQGIGSGTANVSISSGVTGLSPNTTYHYQAVASNSVATVYGNDATLSTGTPAVPPTVSTTSATNVQATAATLNGTVNPNGASTTAYFQWGTTTGYGNTTPVQTAGGGSSPVGVAADILGLQTNTTYHFQLVATNSAGTTFGNDMSFSTNACSFSVSFSTQVFQSSGGTGTVNVTASSSSCSWTASSTVPWITLSSSTGTGNGSVNYTVASNTTQGTRVGELMVAGMSLFVSQNGIGSLGFDVALPGGNVISKVSSGTGPLSVSYGFVTATATAPPVVLANFGLTSGGVLITEVGIPAGTSISSTRLFVDYSSTTNSGLAIVNPGLFTLNLTLTLRSQAGVIVSSSLTSLGAGAHLARFVDQLGLNLPNPFLGTLTVTGNGPFAAINLRTAINGRGETLFSALPLVDLGAPPTGTTLLFPQMVDGGGSPTQILLMNPSDSSPSAGTISLFDDNGNPLSLDFGPGIGLQSSLNYALPQSGMLKYSTTGLGSLRVGYVVVTAASGSLPVGSVVFSTTGGAGLASQAGVMNTLPATTTKMFVDITSSSPARNTGVAFVNRNTTTANLSLLLSGVDGSTRSASLTLPPNGHMARFITELFSGVPASFQGLLTVNSSVPVAALTLRLTTNQRGETITSTLPVAGSIVNVNYPLIIPQIVNGGGYQTQIILLNPDPTSSQVHIDFLNDSGAFVSLPLN